MSFWNLDDGTSAAETGTSFEVSTSNEPIPDGSCVLAYISDVKWDEWQGTEYLKITWKVAKPAELENRVVFHKLYVTDPDRGAKDPKAKTDKAKRMLAAIDANAGGKLLKIAAKPTNEQLAIALINKTMVIRVHVYETDDGKTGNWVAAVMPKDHELKIGETKPRANKQKASAAPVDDWGTGNGGPSASRGRSAGFDDDLADEVPFISCAGIF